MRKRLTKLFQKNVHLVLVVLFAAALRFIFPSTPPSLNWDEISHGYNAYSILRTAHDEWGNFLPLIFKAYGDYKLPVYIYLTVISEFFFGLTAFAVRLPSILAGIGTTVFTYLLVETLFKDLRNKKRIAALSALLVAVEPWSLFLSRAAFEANLALFLFTGGIFFFLKYIDSQSDKNLIYSTLLLGLTVWTYNSYRIFTPLMVVFLAALYWEKLKALFKNPSKSVFVSFVVLALFLLPMFYQLFTSAGRARYSWVQILDEGAIARINEARSLGGSRVVHNKMTYFLFDFSKNYLAHFSLSFLFLDGGTNYQFSVPERGLLYFIDLPFLLLGFFFLTKRAIMGRGKTALLLLFWLFLAPIASSLTREAPHVLRSITFLPVPMIISSYGIAQVGSRVAKRANLYLYLCFLLVLSFVAINYMRDYFRRYRINYSQAWQYGYQQVADFIGEYYSNYDKIVVTKKYGEPHEFLLFYLKWPPEKYLTDSTLNRFFQTNWFWVDGFDKFYFVNDWQVKNQGLGDYTFKQESEELVQCDPEVVNCLLITTKGNVPGGWNRIKYVNFLNGQTAFELYEN